MYRRFSEAHEEVAAQWAKTAIAGADWNEWQIEGRLSAVQGQNETESKPFKAHCGLVAAVMKPGIRKVDGTFRAAHEKIASDLAYHLGLPVPACILVDRGPSVPQGDERYVALIHWAFPQAQDFATVRQILTDDMRRNLSPVVSSIEPFEAFIASEDRKDAHFLVGQAGPNAPMGVAFIDYAYSLSRTWKREASPNVRPRSYFGDIQRDQNAVLHVAQEIANLDPEVIKEITGRIPQPFLADDAKAMIQKGLLDNQSRLMDGLGLNAA